MIRQQRYCALARKVADSRVRAYTRGVTIESPGHSEEAAAPVLLTKTRRRPPSQAEQARRQAWGRKYGALVKQRTSGIRRER